MKYFCCDERRRQIVKELGVLNGIEYVEVSDRAAPSEELRQRTLFVRLLRPLDAGTVLNKRNFRVSGGERTKTVDIKWVKPADPLPAGEDPALVDGLSELDHYLLVRTQYRGDFSLYTLSMVSGPDSDLPPDGFDPLLVDVQFSFKVECESDFDCRTELVCPVEPSSAPVIDYLSKDYASFRRLMLDRMSLTVPQWRERSPADLGVALVELLAYVGDHLSYQQDAIATEAYIGTARRRVSVRRHARLVDYRMHEGCNARAWVRVCAATAGATLVEGTQLLSRVAGLPDVIVPDGPEHRAAINQGATVFEAVCDTVLYPKHEQFEFYTWGQRSCCLPRGATKATLRGELPNLKAGDVLVLAEVADPKTEKAEDADRARRWAVRLTHVVPSEDPSGGLFESPPTAEPVRITEIEWDEDDALPLPLCISTEGNEDLEVSVAWGNIVLADHGRTVADGDLGAVANASMRYAPTASDAPCGRDEVRNVPVRYCPTLKESPLTHSPPEATPLFEGPATPQLLADLDSHSFSSAVHDWFLSQGASFDDGPAVVRGGNGVWSISDGQSVFVVRAVSGVLWVSGREPAASRTTQCDPREARPSVKLIGTHNSVSEEWTPRFDLLSSDESDAGFVAEVEDDGTVRLRFGDDEHGKRPNAGTSFSASYRVGNGTAGNVGAEAIAHVVTNDESILWVSNPMPAAGGVDPESLEAVRRDAPEAFKIQERAVTPKDYADVVERYKQVQQAAATFRWTGSWHTVFVTVDRGNGKEVDTAFEDELRNHVEKYRMAGHDLEVDGPRYVPLEVGMHVCVKPNHFRGHMKPALLTALGNGVLPDGELGLFHSDNFTFGQPVYLSQLYARAQSVEGVESVTIHTFQRLREPCCQALDEGVLSMGRLEIARLDNDPNFPERGVLKLTLGGGK